eukprot:scaffold434_cov175-Amphora_coffeaeformis.AAC.3
MPVTMYTPVFWIFSCLAVATAFSKQPRVIHAPTTTTRANGCHDTISATTRLFEGSNGFNVNRGFPYNDEDNHRPSKADLYSTEELENLLHIHQALDTENTFVSEDNKSETDEGPVPFGLHDMVLQALEEMEVEQTKEAEEPAPVEAKPSYTVSEETKRVLLGIRAVASDVDGTLTCSDQSVHPQTQVAVKKAIEEAFSPVRSLRYFFPATGKTRAALTSLGPELAVLLSQCPGVFVQGCHCVDANGNVVYEHKLGQAEADAVIQFGESEGLSVFGYDGESIYTTAKSNPRHVREFHEVWGEPAAIIIDSTAGYQPRFHKLLLWCDDVDANTKTYRPKLEELAASHDGTVTMAIPTMLEFLPRGASKAMGVKKLCEYLGIDMSTELLAIGDAENDMGFLRESAFGVAVGNAVPKTKKAADLVLNETNNEGGAGIAIDLFGLGGIFREK